MLDDPGRIAAQVVSGIGFLGAAAILRFGFSVRGVTIATSLWSVSRVGLAVGSGFYFGAVIATTLIVLSLSLFDRLEKALFIKKYIRNLTLVSKDTKLSVESVTDVFEARDVEFHKISIDRNQEYLSMTSIVKIPKDLSVDTIIKDAMNIEGVAQVKLE